MTDRTGKGSVPGEPFDASVVRVRRARAPITRVIEEELGEIRDQIGGSMRFPSGYPCTKWSCEMRERYRALLAETIREIEATRGSFKSKRLAELRARLEEVLRVLPPADLSNV